MIMTSMIILESDVDYNKIYAAHFSLIFNQCHCWIGYNILRLNGKPVTLTTWKWTGYVY